MQLVPSRVTRFSQIFAYWAIVFFRSFVTIKEVVKSLCATFFNGRFCLLIKTKMVGTHFGPFFSQTHLITLMPSQIREIESAQERIPPRCSRSSSDFKIRNQGDQIGRSFAFGLLFIWPIFCELQK
jgi:hypothetical protein